MSFIANLKDSVAKANRLMLVVGGAAVLAGCGWYFGGPGPVVATSDIRGPNTNKQTVHGQLALSPEYDRNLIQSDTQRVEKAEREGSSALPTVKVAEEVAVPMPLDKREPSPDLDKLQRPTPPQIERPTVGLAPMSSAPVPVRIADNSPQVDAVANAMRAQLADLGKVTYAPATVNYYSKQAGGVAGAVSGALSGAAGTAGGGLTAAERQSQSASGAAPSPGAIGNIPLPLPGTIVYAELVGEANSDAPGPILARVLQGELAGATVIGSFSTMRESLVLKFSTLSIGTSAAGDDINKAVAINAVGVDSKTISPGIATDVDHHMLQNVGFTAASAFATGFGNAIAQSGQTMTNTSGVGTQITNPTRTMSQQLYIAGGAAAGAVGSTLSNIYGNRPTTITIAAGTPVGILFMPTQNQ